jgi:menaquinone-dependent protoporphyrinogen oxidase
MPAQRRVLVTHGSKRGGTAELAEMIAEVLREHGLTVDCLPAAGMPEVSPYDAVIVGGALYMTRWHRAARRFVRRNAAALQQRKVWMFSTGPLDDSASHELRPVRGVAELMAKVGARGHVTFGGRLAPDAHGFIASKMARTHAGDWRDRDAIRTWAASIAASIGASSEAVPVPVPAPEPSSRRKRLLVATLCFAVGMAVLMYAPTTGFVMPGLILLFVVGAAAIGMVTALQRSRA